MPINWRNEMSVGNALIDHQHQYLICLINCVEAAVGCGLGEKVLLNHVSELRNYTDIHFAKEEELQAEIHFPFRDAHKKEHINLLKQLQAIRANLESAAKGESYNAVVQGLFDMLRDWLITHVLNEDMKMRDYFKQQSKHA